MTPKMGDQEIERIIDIIDDGELTAEAQERLRQESMWPLYESLRQKATAVPLCSATQMGNHACFSNSMATALPQSNKSAASDSLTNERGERSDDKFLQSIFAALSLGGNELCV